MGIMGIFLIMGNAGFISSTVGSSHSLGLRVWRALVWGLGV